MGELKEHRITILSEGEGCYSLREAWKNIYGRYPESNSLALLWAQWAFEDGRGQHMNNYNWGNIKRAADEDYCMVRCNEYINGVLIWFDPPNKQTWFRAYETALDGAIDYIKFLSQKTRYAKAWNEVISGNPHTFVVQLKAAGYFTDTVEHYEKSVTSLFNEFKKKYDALVVWQPENAPEKNPEPTEVNSLEEQPDLGWIDVK